MQSSSVYENKELEDFIEGEYVNIRDGESRVLEFIKGKEKLVDKTDFDEHVNKVHYIEKSFGESFSKFYLKLIKLIYSNILKEIEASFVRLFDLIFENDDNNDFVKAINLTSNLKERSDTLNELGLILMRQGLQIIILYMKSLNLYLYMVYYSIIL